MGICDWASGRVFEQVHGRNLVYNACWEDPRIDRQALALEPEDTVAVITSAGCNALDYALAGPRAVHAVDVNRRQNALLELKIAGIRSLDYATFFDIFGRGRRADFREIYRDALRDQLSRSAAAFWNRRLDWFTGRHRRRSFYFHGAAGWFAFAVNLYIDRVVKLRDAMQALLNAGDVESQREIYESAIRPRFWNGLLRWTLARDSVLAMLGVPRDQRQQLELRYPGGIARFIEESVAAVFAQLPLQDNYFWRVYLAGEYTPDCCPGYLTPEGFAALQSGLVNRVAVHTSTFEEFLRRQETSISKFVLLDHMDWMARRRQHALASEWQAIVDRAAMHSTIIWRSAAPIVDFVDPIRIWWAGRASRLGDLLTYDRTLASRLHAADRVHTYGSFHIAHFHAA